MRIVAIAFLLVSVITMSATAATKVFILAGQSNMDGRGKKSELTGDLEKWAKPQADVRIAYSNSTIRGPYTSGGFKPLEPGYSVPPGSNKLGDKYKLPAATFGPEVSFGRTIADALPSDKIVIIKFSEGGTSLHKDWKLDQPAGLYEQFLAFTQKSLKDLNDTYELAGMVWHQGEADASLKAGEYQKLLTAFIERVRKDLNAPQLPFVVAEVFDNKERDAVRSAQRATTQAVAQTIFVPASDLTTNDHGTHFDTKSQITLGQRIARACLDHNPTNSK